MILMNQSSHVSIIMPARNAALYIGQSIESVRLQTHADWELLVVDDGSTDGTIEKVQEFQAVDPRIRLIPLPVSQGVGITRNIGIKSAVGAYIAFLDADDLWLPQKLEMQLRFMQENRVAVSYTSYRLMDESGREEEYYIQARQHLSFNRLLRGFYIGNLTGMYHASSIGKIYGAPIRRLQAWSLWLDAVKRAGKAQGLTLPLAVYRQRKNTKPETIWKLLPHLYVVYRKTLGLNVVRSYWNCLIFVVDYLLMSPRSRVSKI